MYFRNVWAITEATNNCKPLLRPLYSNNYKVQVRNAFRGSRGRCARRGPGFEPDPLEHIQIESGPLHVRGLAKPFVFAVGISSASLAACAIWEYENLRSHASKFLRRPGAWLNSQQKKLSTRYKSEAGPIKKWWNGLKDTEKVFYPILLANVLVFGAWRVRSWQPFMVKYFCSNPVGSAVCLPMLLSTFSHYSPLHLAANMYVLYSFMPAAVASLGKEQFLAMYLSAGVTSSFASFLYKVLFKAPGLSLGASGAIMGVLSYVCVQYPDTRLSIIFLPIYTFAAGTAIKVIMSIDLAGILLGWKFFDHAAHLGGALYGIAWSYWIESQVWGNRDKFLQYYHNVRRNDR